METGFQYLFLKKRTLFFSAFLAALVCGPGIAQAQDEGLEQEDELEQIITPDLKRREVKEEDLDTENFQLGIFFGLLSLEDFGTNNVQGVNLAYHVTEDVYLEANYGISEAKKTSYELLSGGVELLTKEQRELAYYNLSIGYNFLHGQVYWSDRLAFNNHFYIALGAGNTEFAEKKYFTTSLGAGLRIYTTDWLALDLSTRGHSFEHELLGKAKRVTNLETRLGLSLFF